MLWWQWVIGNIVLIFLICAVAVVLRKFDTKNMVFLPLYFVLVLFSLGFAFRLSGNNDIVNMGFYFTEMSFLFVNVVFTIALLLGQKKYWKLK